MSRLLVFFASFLTILQAVAAPPQPMPNKIELTIVKTVADGDGQKVLFKLINRETGKPITFDDLQTIHTRRIHLLIIDQNLKDYSHVHSQATREPGIYQFSWKPADNKTNYNIWADITLKQGNQHDYLLAPLVRATNKPASIDRQTSYQTTVNGFHFALTFDSLPLHTGKAAMGKITVTDSQGKPVTNLEPVMGSYAHIVGFDDDFKTVIHIHPMGKEPTNPTDRGGPVLEFHLEAEKAGFIKLFAQVKINGQELYAPFGINVE